MNSNHWTKTTIKEIACVKGGKRLPKGIMLQDEPNMHPYIRVRDIKSRRIEVWQDSQYVDNQTFRAISRYIVNSGDVILSIVGTVGVAALVGISLDNASLTENCIRFTNLTGITNEFLYYYLISDEGQSEIKKGTVGAVQPKLPIKNILSMRISIPPLPEQRAIAATLSCLDDKIELNNRMNKTLEEMAQAVFRSWFVDFEPFDGAKPTTWVLKTLDEVCANITDGVHNTVIDDAEGKYLLLSCKNIKNGSVITKSNERRINRETFLRLRKRTKLEKGDILLSSVGTIGEMALLMEEPTNFELQRSVAIIKPKTDILSSVFLYESLVDQKLEIINSSHGAVQQCLFIGDIKDFKIMIPDTTIIDKFSMLVLPLFEKITQNSNENVYLTNVRDILLPKLMSGEIPVPSEV